MNNNKLAFSVVSVYSDGVNKPGWRFNPVTDCWDTACVISIRDGLEDTRGLFGCNVRPITLVPAEMEGELSEYLSRHNDKGMTFEDMSRIVYGWIARHWPYPTLSDRLHKTSEYNQVI